MPDNFCEICGIGSVDKQTGKCGFCGHIDSDRFEELEMTTPMLPSHDPWQWNPELCPADTHFIEWMHLQQGQTILHLGTGAHHRVGKALCARHSILGLTISGGEMQAYEDWAIINPELSQTYKVLFGDVFLTDFHLLPSFDIITLFHLGEIRSEDYDSLTLEQVIEGMVERVGDGTILTYTRSHVAADVTAVLEKYMRLADTYKTLRVYQI